MFNKTFSLVLAATILSLFATASPTLPENTVGAALDRVHPTAFHVGIPVSKRYEDYPMEHYLNNRTVKCETSCGSPTLCELEALMNMLSRLGGGTPCDQRNPTGSKCTTCASSGNAAINICGGSFKSPGLNYTELELAIKVVSRNCTNPKVPGRAGGKFADVKGLSRYGATVSVSAIEKKNC